MSDENYQNTQSAQMSVEPFTNESSLRYRLDTESFKRNIRLFLEGKSESIERDVGSGRLVQVQRDIGKPLANQVGIQRIMAKISFLIDPSMVQGNLNNVRYELFMERARRSLAHHIMVNLYDYDISQEEYGFICDNIMDAIELFVSRTINDGERRSYAGWMVHSENSNAGNTKKAGIWDRLTGKA